MSDKMNQIKDLAQQLNLEDYGSLLDLIEGEIQRERGAERKEIGQHLVALGDTILNPDPGTPLSSVAIRGSTTRTIGSAILQKRERLL